MLDDRERGLLAEIERGLLLDAPELTRSFEAFASGPVSLDAAPGNAVTGNAVPHDTVAGDAVPGDAVPHDAVPGDAVPLETVAVARTTPVVRARRRRRDRASTAVAGLVLGTVLLAGPRALTGSEVARRAAARPPRVRLRTASP
ncbi:hypothetical protein SAMN05216207_1011173 [Pseudonocardia ammonioxydans]|uniref:DUF3040 domain-containing protein n=1 Tax=Pseudonocardia ammonioxydans TaxID=260086 RepID=A0A1I4XR48_PSUAM|nr:hypothetical protein [Pseudonocardia ammonioxydans]SFN27759.1 hypothetical protein SAMN05216207_1011173 [Pseudonocardia ammonioxydans]